MKNIKRFSFVLLFIGINLSSAAIPSGSAISITTAPTTITQSGNYRLANDISSGAITIAADNVTLDLCGRSVSGQTSGGIIISGQSDIIIKNGIMSSGTQGISVTNCTDVIIEDIEYRNVLTAINVVNTIALDVEDCTIKGGITGINVSGSNNGIIRACDISGTFTGVALISSTTAFLLDSLLVSNHAADGISLQSSSSQNTILDCVISSSTSGTRGIVTNSCAAIHIVGCEIWGNTEGIKISNSSKKNIIKNCIIKRAGTGIAVSYVGTDTAYLAISGCICEQNSSNGISYSGTGTDLLVLEGNVSSANNGAGIVLAPCGRSIIKGNTLNDNGGYGIIITTCNNLAFYDNDIGFNALGGIGSGGTPNSNNTIFNNRAQTNGPAMTNNYETAAVPSGTFAATYDLSVPSFAPANSFVSVSIVP